MAQQKHVKKHFKYIITVVFFWLGWFGAGAAPADVTADTLSARFGENRQGYCLRIPEENFLRQFREDPAFQYHVKYVTPTWWDDFKLWLLKHLLRWSWGIESNWLEIVAKVLAALLAAFLIYKLLRTKYVFPFSRKRRSGEGERGLEGTLDTVSYPEMVKQAVSGGDYVLAVRIHYLYLLQVMDEKGIIRWDAHKTDGAYVYEIRQEGLREGFVRLSHVFNCVCYGEFPVDGSLYHRLAAEFNHFHNELEA